MNNIQISLNIFSTKRGIILAKMMYLELSPLFVHIPPIYSEHIFYVSSTYVQ